MRHFNIIMSVLLMTLFYIPSGYALTLSASPSPSDTASQEERYQRIVDVIRQHTEYKDLEFAPEKKWGEFSRKLISKQYDILIAEPHIIAYSANYQAGLKMRVLARFSGELSYHLVVKNDAKAQTVKDLEQMRICMRPSPSLGNILITKLYKNPVTIPTTVSINQSDASIMKQFSKRRCDAAVVSDDFYKSIAEQNQFRSIHQTQSTLNLGISMSDKIQPENRAIILRELKKLNLSEISPAYGKNQTIIDAKNEDFESFDILAGLVWGW